MNDEMPTFQVTMELANISDFFTYGKDIDIVEDTDNHLIVRINEVQDYNIKINHMAMLLPDEILRIPIKHINYIEEIR